MLRWTLIFLAVAAVAATVAWMRPGIEPDRTAAMLRLAPGIAPATARHLALDDDDAFRRYCRAAGTIVVKAAMGHLDSAIDTTSIEAFSRTWDAALPHQMRLVGALAHEFNCPDYLRDLEIRARLATEARWRVQRLIGELRLVGGDGAMPTAEKMRACQELGDRFRALGYERGVMLAELSVSNEVMELGRGDLRLIHLHRALWIARSLGETYMTCQILGELGSALRGARRDSMVICYDEALGIARRCRFADQVARILFFYAKDHASEGRLGMATDLVMEAQRVCRDLGGGGEELRFLAGAIEFFSDLGCWEISARLLRRAPVLLRDPMAAAWQLDLERLKARVLLASGQIDDAERVIQRIRGPARANPHRTAYAALVDQWSAGLVEAGRMAAALPVVEEGLAYCDSLHVPEYALGLALRRAQVLCSLGRCEPAWAALGDFERRARDSGSPDEPLAIEALTLKARLLDARGDRGDARFALARAFDRLRDHARRLDPGPQGYLALASFQDLRFAAHDLLPPTPMAGYEVEREWRAIPSELGRKQHDAPPASDAGRTTLPPEGAFHCVYLVRPQAMVRWTANAVGVRRDTLAIEPGDCTRRIRAVVQSMARRRGGESAPDPRPLESELRDLARLLLPREAFATGGRGPAPVFYITPDGPLGMLPFEALNLAADGYEALAQRFDVAYVREAGGGGGARAPGESSILADPLTSREFRRRFPYAYSVEASHLEANVVRSAWPDAHLLRGADATKRAVIEAWSRAPRIHVAAHLARDPEIPFIGFIPMATAPGASASEEAFMELADIRAIDLSGCELVVLSSCASGTPYLSARRLGPSIGDGFLDAGAHAVVQTFWEIEDREARSFVADFLHQLEARSPDPVRALNAARRHGLGPSGLFQPELWATWSVDLRSLPERTMPVTGRLAHGSRPYTVAAASAAAAPAGARP